MKIAVGCDHGGFAVKEAVLSVIKKLGHEIIDCGTNSCDSVDYPDFSERVGELVSEKEADRGILLCGSGVGVCITANKIKGVRASVCHDTYSAAQGVNHDDMNVLCLGGRIVGPALVEALTEAFLTASYGAVPRHQARLDKVLAIENKNFK
ncbi:ribose 5-phosphate isomerase B [Parelusimicrobium proximum]|uniref:ribose 5-phosphate isomerase B n=1 Tax=Parelusimicrobium proximum TaxID=3228953 RepID=UPI003D177C0F